MAEIAGNAPTLAQVIRAAVRRGLKETRVMVPARVLRWDASTQRIDAEVLLQEDLGGPLPVSLAPLLDIPMVFPGAGGFRLTFPVSVGDTVALVFSDRSLDRWLNAGGVVDPGTYRMHDLSDAIAIPGLHPWSAPWTGLDATAVTLGKDGVASHYAGLGDRLATALTNISTWLTTHTHASNGTASALPAPTIPVVASSTVKVTE